MKVFPVIEMTSGKRIAIPKVSLALDCKSLFLHVVTPTPFLLHLQTTWLHRVYISRERERETTTTQYGLGGYTSRGILRFTTHRAFDSSCKMRNRIVYSVGAKQHTTQKER